MTSAASPSPSTTRSGVIQLYKELWHWSSGHRIALLCAFALLLLSAFVKLGIPYLAGRAINTLQLNGTSALLDAGVWLGLVFSATVLSWALHGPGRILERFTAQTVRGRVSSHLTDRLLQLPLSWHERHHSASTAHRVSQSSRALSDFAQTQFIYLQSVVRLVGPVAALWLIEPWVGAAALLGLLVISSSVTGFDRAMMRLAHTENDAERRYNTTLVDTFSSIVSVFALRQTRKIHALIQQRVCDIDACLKRTIMINEAKWCTVDLLAQGLSCALLVLYAWMAAYGTSPVAPSPQTSTPSTAVPLGNIYMVWEYALQAGAVITTVAAHFQTLARQHADYASAAPILETQTTPTSQSQPPGDDTSPDHSPTTKHLENWHAIHLQHLNYAHANGTPGLQQVSLTLERGKRYALIGSSGSGKSTLLRLLAGLYSAQTLCLETHKTDGACDTYQDQHVAAAWLRRYATLIPQDAEVFEGTVADNLSLCETVETNPPPSDFWHALTLACATDFLSADESGLHARVAEHGSNWSGGQRQRLALARGILAAQGSPLVLMDEPTSSLDPHTEHRILLNVFNAFRQACVVSSVHRLHLLPLFDEVLIMEAGQVLDRGPVAELSQRHASLRVQLMAPEAPPHRT